jgi:hypothetical protein
MKFRPDAAERYQDRAQEILNEIQAFSRVAPSQTNVGPDIHVSHVFTPDQILSISELSFLHDNLGILLRGCLELSRDACRVEGHWIRKNQGISEPMVHKGPARDLVAEEFAVDVTCY